MLEGGRKAGMSEEGKEGRKVERKKNIRKRKGG